MDENIAGFDLEIFHEKVANIRRHVLMDAHLRHRAELSFADARLHRFKQVVRFQFLDFDIRIADDAEGIHGHDLHPRK